MSTSYLAWAKRTLEDPDLPLNLVNSGYPSRELEDLTLPFPDDSILRAPNSYGWPPLSQAIGESYGLDSDHITPAAGATMANYLALKAWITPGDTVLLESPTYQPLRSAIESFGGNIVSLERSEEGKWEVPEQSFLESLKQFQPKLVVLTSPHNPSGRAESCDQLRKFSEWAAAEQSHVLVDTVYADYFDWDPVLLGSAIASGFLTLTSSLTKVLGFGPLRVGWIASSPELTQRYKAELDRVMGCHGGINERLGLACWQERTRLIAEARNRVEFNRNVLQRFLGTQPELTWVDPEAGPLALLGIRGVTDSGPLSSALLQRGVAVAPGQFFGSPAFFRIGLAGDPMELRQALREIGRILPEFLN